MKPPVLRTWAAWTAKVLAGLLVVLAPLTALPAPGADTDAGPPASGLVGLSELPGLSGFVELVEEAPAAGAEIWAPATPQPADGVADPWLPPTGWALVLLPLLLAAPAPAPAAAHRRHRTDTGPSPGRGPPFALAS